MIVYTVSTSIKKSVMQDWIDWMTNEHIPEVMATGCFTGFELLKINTPALSADEVTFVINYSLKSIDDYYEYAEKFSPTLQIKHQEKFPGKFKASRSVSELIKSGEVKSAKN